jgi:phage FluMu protein Com
MASLRCPNCNRTLASSEAMFSHVKAKHGLNAARVCVPDHPVFVREAERRARRQGHDREPSMADLVIEATLNRAMGLPVDPDIAEMFDV